jgi:predicted ATP-dependent endonuclease of OLD family
VLLDEPALTLHGRAQADFLRYIEVELAPIAQVVYSTHSPFMVDSSELQRVRIVEDKGADDGSVVSAEALSVGADSLFPLQAALGYDIAQNLFVGPDNLLVEGTSDFTYLTVISDLLADNGKEHLDPRWRILPAGSASNIPTFVALVGKALDVTVLIDGSTKSSVAKIADLAARGYLVDKRVFITDTFSKVKASDIEDLFTPGDYLVLYNGAFATKIVVADLDGSDRIISRISRHTGADFVAHGKPADYLLRNRDTVLPALSPQTLEHFEALFVAINKTLS